MDLRNSHVALINHQEHVLWEIVQQAVGWCTWFTSVEIAAIVLNSRAIPKLLNHLHIVFHALLNAFGIERLADIVEVLHLVCQIQFDLANGICLLVGIHAEDSGGVDVVRIKFLQYLLRGEIKGHDSVNLVAEELYAQDVIGIGEGNIHGVTLHTESPAGELVVVADVLGVDEGVE